jgi:hypothetical protein
LLAAYESGVLGEGFLPYESRGHRECDFGELFRESELELLLSLEASDDLRKRDLRERDLREMYRETELELLLSLEASDDLRKRDLREMYRETELELLRTV